MPRCSFFVCRTLDRHWTISARLMTGSGYLFSCTPPAVGCFPARLPDGLNCLRVCPSAPRRCVSIFPDQQGFAVGSIEGRVGIEYFSEQAAKAQASAGGYKPVSTYGNTKLSFAFKCHRITVSPIRQPVLLCLRQRAAPSIRRQQPLNPSWPIKVTGDMVKYSAPLSVCPRNFEFPPLLLGVKSIFFRRCPSFV